MFRLLPILAALALALPAVAEQRHTNFPRDFQTIDPPRPAYPPNPWQPGYPPAYPPNYVPGWGAQPGIILPMACVIVAQAGGVSFQVVTPDCLTGYGFKRRLPSRCAVDARDGTQTRRYFRADCLQERGYGFSDQ